MENVSAVRMARHRNVARGNVYRTVRTAASNEGFVVNSASVASASPNGSFGSFGDAECVGFFAILNTLSFVS